MSFLALSLSRKISYAKNFVLLPPEIPGGRYNLLLIAVNQIFYHRFIGLLLKLHDLLLCHISRNWLHSCRAMVEALYIHNSPATR